MKKLLIVLLSSIYISASAQNKNMSIGVVPSLEYTFQKKHSFGAWIGFPINHKKRPHTFLIPNLGGYLMYAHKSSYFSPGVNIELYHQLDKLHVPFGIYLRGGYYNLKTGGQNENVFFADLGLSNFYLHFFLGYNRVTSKRESDFISPFRIGIKLL